MINSGSASSPPFDVGLMWSAVTPALTAVFERHEFGATRKCGAGIGRALNAQACAEMAQRQNFRG
jgi:hypothetical protein